MSDFGSGGPSAPDTAVPPKLAINNPSATEPPFDSISAFPPTPALEKASGPSAASKNAFNSISAFPPTPNPEKPGALPSASDSALESVAAFPPTAVTKKESVTSVASETAFDAVTAYPTETTLLIGDSTKYASRRKPRTIRDLYEEYRLRFNIDSRDLEVEAAEDDGQWLVHIIRSRARVTPWNMILISTMAAVVAVFADVANPGGVGLGIGVLSMFGIPVGFLLTWRVTTSHARWWEGRNAWTVIEQSAVDLCLQAYTYCSDQPEIAYEIVRSCAAFVFAERNCLQTDEVLKQEDPNHMWETTLLGGEWDRIMDPVHYSLKSLRDSVKKAILTCPAVVPPLGTNMDSKVTTLLVADKKIETLQRQPMPESYVVLLRTLLLLYLALVPLVSIKALEPLASILFQFIISFALLGAESAAAEIERPYDNTYNDVPVNPIVLRIALALATIEEDIEEMLPEDFERQW